MEKDKKEVLGLVIEDGSDLSINDLIKLKKAEFAIARTGHIGNQYKQNLALLLVGLYLQIYDRNIKDIDENYWPGYILFGGKKIRISDNEKILSPFAVFTEINKVPKKFLNGSKTPAQMHIEVLKNLYPGQIYTESDLLTEYPALVKKMVHCLVEHYPEEFSRFVNSNGELFKTPDAIKNQGDLVCETCLKLKHLCSGNDYAFEYGIVPKGIIVPLISSIITSIKSAKSVVYELAGPDMEKYALKKNFAKRMNEAYLLLKKNIVEIPEQLKIVIVPTFHLKFVCLSKEAKGLNELLENIEDFMALNQRKRIALNPFKNLSKKERSEDINKKMQSIGEAYREKLQALATKINNNPMSSIVDINLSRGDFFSQYDLLESGDKLYLPEKIMSLSMSSLKTYFQAMKSSAQYL